MAAGKHILAKAKGKRVFGTAKVGDRGQIVIPKEARELFNIKPGDTLLILGEEDTGLIVSRPDVLSSIANQLFVAIIVIIQSLSRVRLCNPMDYSMPVSTVLLYLLEFAQIHVH